MEKIKADSVHMLDMSLLGEEARKSFYPTPDTLAEEMVRIVLENLPKDKRYSDDYTILEPSAGDGRLIRMIGKYFKDCGTSIYGPDYIEDALTGKKYAPPRRPNVDYIEIDKNLRAVIKDAFSEERKYELREKRDAHRGRWDREFQQEIYEEGHKEKYDFYSAEYNIINNLGDVHCVGDDFMEFQTFKKYDLIIMNPPFASGAEHLLKAINMQKRMGGSIVCLLNAETLRNPYTLARKELVRELRALNADIKYLKDTFISAERSTEVDIALAYIDIDKPAKYSYIFEDLQKAKEETLKAKEPTYITTQKESYIEESIEQYNFEIELTLRLVEEYEAIKPYIPCVFVMPEHKRHETPAPIISLTLGRDGFSLNKYLQVVREKYWRALFHNPDFSGALTSNLRDEFESMISSMKDYDYNEFNIKQIKKRMAEKMEESYYDTILELFDKLSCVHSYSGQPEETNVWMYNGWKTNKSWKINDKKVILPCYGVFRSYSFNSGFDPYEAYRLLGDIERTLNYIDNGRTEEPILSLSDILATAERQDAVRNLDTKYFKVTFYKKGTCHIMWKDKKLIEKLNIFGSQKKGWLPPGYGKKAYKDMDAEEKAVIDEFQGEVAYEKVMAESEYYLSNNSIQLPLLA